MMTEDIKYTIEDLKFMKLLVPRLIPKHLIEQVKGKPYSPDDFYKSIEEDIESDNPYSIIYVLVNPENDIVGYAWVLINPLEHCLYVNTISIDKQYWGKGEVIHKFIKFLHKKIEHTDIKQVIWMTTNPKFYEKLGFRRCRDVAMEYKGE